MNPLDARILTINGGSSSIKFAVFDAGAPPRRLMGGAVERMRDLLDREAQDVRAAEAVAVFCYQVKKWVGSFVAALGGLNTLVFAGGIGENAPTVRSRICSGLNCLGVELSEPRNASGAAVISTAASRVTVLVMRTDEERMIARSVCLVRGLG